MKAMMPVRSKSANVFQPTLAVPEPELSSGGSGSNSGGAGSQEDEDEPVGGDSETSVDPALHTTAPPPAPMLLPPAPMLLPSTPTLRPPTPTPASAVLQHKRRFSVRDFDPGSGTTSSASTPGPALKRRHLSAAALAPDPQVTALNVHLEDFTDAFRDATGTSSAGEPGSPSRKRRAIRSAQELEVDLSDDQLVILVDLFTKDVSAADAYMELKRVGLRKAWVAKRLESLS